MFSFSVKNKHINSIRADIKGYILLVVTSCVVKNKGISIKDLQSNEKVKTHSNNSILHERASSQKD